MDEGNHSVKEYSLSGEFISKVTIPSDVAYAPWARFVYLDSLLYLPNIKGSAASVVNRQGELVKQFGKRSEEFGGRILLRDKNHIWAIGIVSPVIEKYTKAGLLVNSLNYSDVSIVKEIKEKSHNSGNSFTAIAQDACLSNGKLYILINNKVLCLSTVPKIELETTYLLPNGFHNSIAVEKDKLYGINNRDRVVERFAIP